MTNQRKFYPNAHKALWKHKAETNGNIPWPEWETEGGNYESVINDCFACEEADKKD